MIFDTCQMALDLNFDGLMVESHWDPDNAWSDAAQQVTPTNGTDHERFKDTRNNHR